MVAILEDDGRCACIPFYFDRYMYIDLEYINYVFFSIKPSFFVLKIEAIH